MKKRKSKKVSYPEQEGEDRNLNEFFSKNWTIAEVKISYKPKKIQRRKVTESEHAYNLLYALWDKNAINYCEEAFALFLNRGSDVVAYKKVGQGGISECTVDPKVILTIALQCGASAIIIAHNHPSGNLEPTEADRSLTYKIKNAARYLNIEILDHLIIADGKYLSFADEGYM